MVQFSSHDSRFQHLLFHVASAPMGVGGHAGGQQPGGACRSGDQEPERFC